MNNSEAHSKLVNEVLLKIGQNFPHIRAWKNHNGQAYTPTSVVEAINMLISQVMNNKSDTMDMFKTARNMLVPIRFGVVGQADISGIISPSGKRLEIEVKTGKGVLSDDQKNFKKMIESMGGVHIQLRDISDLGILHG